MSSAGPAVSEPLDSRPDDEDASAVVATCPVWAGRGGAAAVEGSMSVDRRAASPGRPAVCSGFVAAAGATPAAGDFTLDGMADEAQPLGISEPSPANAADDSWVNSSDSNVELATLEEPTIPADPTVRASVAVGSDAEAGAESAAEEAADVTGAGSAGDGEASTVWIAGPGVGEDATVVGAIAATGSTVRATSTSVCP
jgi:hypothetical protein